MPQAVKVGIFVTVCLLVLGYLILEVEDLRLFGGGGQRVDAVFDSVVGLDDKAPVRVAGVRVGRVDGTRLDGHRARVTLLLEVPVPLTRGARASIANAGILGDKYVELILGPEGAPPLGPDEVLPGSAAVSFDEALAQLSELGESLQEITGDLSGRDLGDSIARLLDNLEATSADIRELVAANRGQVAATLANFERFSGTLAEELPALTAQMRELLAHVDSVVAENRGELAEGLGNIRDLTERLQTSVDNMNSISGQIASGEGTLGKLVFDDEAHDSLVSTLGTIEEGVGSLSDTLGHIRKVRFDLGLESSYLTELEEYRTTFSLRLDPPSTRFYLVEVVDDPRGEIKRDTQVITTTFPDGRSETRTIETLRSDDDLTISAQFGFRFGQADLRAGLFESVGGGALDYHLFDRRLKLSLEAFDFSREGDLDPRLRFLTRYRFHDNLYLMAGYDDFLVEDNESVFFGAGVRWNDDDLKYLLGAVPSF